MKQFKLFLFIFAFLSLSISTLGQNTYIITGSGTQFTVHKDETPIATNQPVQYVINAIKIDANGTNCTIQFGNDGNILDIGTNNIVFEGISAWGLITLTGKLTSECNTGNNNTVYIANDVSVNSHAEISSTTTDNYCVTILNNSIGMLTISGGTVKNTSDDGIAIYNYTSGVIEVSGGTVSATTGIAIWNNYIGKITVSGTALVTSAHITDWYSTIYLNDYGTETDCRLEITGGRVENTGGSYMGGSASRAVRNNSYGIINISGGEIATYCWHALYSERGTINISGGTITGIVFNHEAPINISGGTLVKIEGFYSVEMNYETVTITGGTIEGTVFNWFGTTNIIGGTISTINTNAVSTFAGAIYISGGTISSIGAGAVYNEEGYVNISGGTVSSTGNAVYNEYASGNINISGGMIVSTGAGACVYNKVAGYITITGGMLLAKEGYAINNISTGTVTLSGGIAFAYGKSKTDVMGGTYTQSSDAVIVAWDKAAGNTEYEAGTDDDIFKSPEETTAVWYKQNNVGGIAVNYNTTEGFIPIADVTVIGMSEIISVTISPKTTTVLQGETQQFFVTVVTINGVDESVIWEVTGNLSASTTISTDGMLTVGSEETAETLTVRVTSVFDPTFFDEAFVTVKGIGIDDISPSSQSVVIYPNPTKGELYVTSYEVQVTSVEVYDIYGKNYTPHISYHTPHTALNISNLSSGVYFVKIFTDNGVIMRKVIKE